MQSIPVGIPAKTSNILDRIEGFGALLANSDGFLHGLFLLFPTA